MTTAIRWLRYLACIPLAATAQAQPRTQAPAPAPAPCTTATTACTEWFTSPAGPGRLLVYRSHSLTRPNSAITRAFILVHGAGRDADNYFRHALAAAFLAGTLENSIVISPRFASNDGRSCRDSLAPGEANWGCGGAGRWTAGGAASGSAQLTSFDITDDLLRQLAKKELFPNLSAIVIAGHSAGGQFVNRYVMTNQVHEKLGVPVTYIVANPSSYAYLDSLRPSVSAVPRNVAALPPGYQLPLPDNPPPPFTRYSDANSCTTYNDWPSGLKDRSGYSARLTDDQLKKQLAARPVIYLLGGYDILPLFGFDGSCPAMAQGSTRFARGLAYNRYANERFGAKHQAVPVPSCGHNGRCMFTSEEALALVYPKR
jgi:hypothetical protein